MSGAITSAITNAMSGSRIARARTGSAMLRCLRAAIIVILALASDRSIGAAESPRGAPAESKPADPLIGCWKADAAGGGFIRFAPDGSCGWIEGDGPATFARAVVTPGMVAMSMMGTRVLVPYTMNGDRLTLTNEGHPQDYHRSATVPAELEPKPLTLGARKPVTAQRTATITAELAQREKNDQAVRKEAAQAANEGAVDTDNTAYLTALVTELGWIDVERFGPDAANAAFLIVQHSGDLSLMLAALPGIEQDVQAKRLDAQAYALLYDRLQLRLGGKQRYGSQIGTVGQSGLLVLPLEDPDHVEARRHAIGLMPLSDYLKFFKPQNGGKDVPFSDD